MACSQEFEHGVFVTESSQQRKRELGPGEWLKGHFRYGCFDFGCVNLFVLFNWVGCRRISVLSRPLVRCSACRACGIRKAARSATIASRDGTSADRSLGSASHWRYFFAAGGGNGLPTGPTCLVTVIGPWASFSRLSIIAGIAFSFSCMNGSSP